MHELVSAGFAGFTIEAVAERAATSRHVVYRRWKTRSELALAALVRLSNGEPITSPDTGSLRGDMIELLTSANRTRLGLVALFSVQLGTYYQETGTTPHDLRTELLGGRPSLMDVVLDRAIARGEADPARLTPLVRTVAIDLMRHEALMTLSSVPQSKITAIVDEVFLPLVTPR